MFRIIVGAILFVTILLPIIIDLAAGFILLVPSEWDNDEWWAKIIKGLRIIFAIGVEVFIGMMIFG